MAHWRLIFRAPTGDRRPLATIADVISRALALPVETTVGEIFGSHSWGGYGATSTIKAQHASGVVIEAEVEQAAQARTDPDPLTTDVFVHMRALPSAAAEKLAIYHALRAAFATLGYRDDTDESSLD